jgi:hypothetical protein
MGVGHLAAGHGISPDMVTIGARRHDLTALRALDADVRFIVGHCGGPLWPPTGTQGEPPPHRSPCVRLGVNLGERSVGADAIASQRIVCSFTGQCSDRAFGL